jgi:hypothetical protein
MVVKRLLPAWVSLSRGCWYKYSGSGSWLGWARPPAGGALALAENYPSPPSSASESKRSQPERTRMRCRLPVPAPGLAGPVRELRLFGVTDASGLFKLGNIQSIWAGGKSQCRAPAVHRPPGRPSRRGLVYPIWKVSVKTAESLHSSSCIWNSQKVFFGYIPGIYQMYTFPVDTPGIHLIYPSPHNMISETRCKLHVLVVTTKTEPNIKFSIIMFWNIINVKLCKHRENTM